MSGTANVKPAKTDAEWARNTEKRLNSVENPTSMRVGEWVLSTDAQTGNLIAGHVDGGSVILAKKPAASQNPDEIVDSKTPFIKVERQQNQSDARGSAIAVIWDTVIAQTRDWGFTAPGTDLEIPVGGVYRVNFHLAFLNASSATNKAIFQVNNEVVAAQEFVQNTAYCGMYVSDTFQFNAGDVIVCAAYVSGSGTMDFGSSGADPSVHTSLTLELISKEED